MTNTAHVTGGKPIAVLLQYISRVRAINSLVACYGMHGGKGEVLFFYFVSDTTRDDETCLCTCLQLGFCARKGAENSKRAPELSTVITMVVSDRWYAHCHYNVVRLWQ
jgi:hypothetical protein